MTSRALECPATTDTCPLLVQVENEGFSGIASRAGKIHCFVFLKDDTLPPPQKKKKLTCRP